MSCFIIKITKRFFCITFILIIQLYLHFVKFICYLCGKNNWICFIDFTENIRAVYKDVRVNDIEILFIRTQFLLLAFKP